MVNWCARTLVRANFYGFRIANALDNKNKTMLSTIIYQVSIEQHELQAKIKVAIK